MKKNRRWLVAIVVSLVMILSMLTPTIAGGHEGYENGVYKTPLLAGQDMEVGEVIVWNDGENLYVKYELNEGAIEEEWGITETHLHIGNGLADFPLAGRQGNPVPGQFDYQRSYDPPVIEDTYTIPLGELEPNEDGGIVIAAHAVVERMVMGSEPTSAVIYGIGTTDESRPNDGDIWMIDPVDASSTRIFENVWDASGVSVGPWWYPNALAFDEENGRLYFSLSRNDLYFYDVATENVVNADPSNKFRNNNDVLGATFAGGSYWYILNQSSMLIEVKLDATGLITEVMSGIDMGSPTVLSQGDIVFHDGVIYGSSGTGAGGGANFKGFFTYDLISGVFESFQDPEYRALQLAFGLNADGEKALYGHQVVNGEWFTVNLENGQQTPVMDGEMVFTTDRFEDLASGFIYEEIRETETAWGAGDRFTQQGNWATYFTYDITDSENGNGGEGNYTKSGSAWSNIDGGIRFGTGNATYFEYEPGSGSGQEPFLVEMGEGANHIRVGDVLVWNDDTTLYIRVNSDEPQYKWDKIDIYVESAAPTQSAPGQLGFTYNPDGLFNEYTHTINLELEATIFIAVHADVFKWHSD